MSQVNPKFIEHISKQLFIAQSMDIKEVNDKNRLVYQVFQYLLEGLSDNNNIDFTTLFSRISYVSATYRLKGNDLYLLHYYRKLNEQKKNENDVSIGQLGVYIIQLICNHVWNVTLNEKIDCHLPSTYADLQPTSKPKKEAFIKLLSTIIFNIDEATNTIYFVTTQDGNETKKALYNVNDQNIPFTINIERIIKYAHFPIECNMVDVTINEQGNYIPRAFVFLPDFLLDVTAIASCYSSEGTQPLYYLLNKFKPSSSSVHLILGNVVNYFLDEIVRDKDVTYASLLPSVFALDPLGFSLLSDGEVVQLLNKAESHFDHLKEVCWNDFRSQNINQANIYLEPSFFSRDYGIQGRLDILHKDTKSNNLDIVELKSGSIFKPNVYGLNKSHYVQTLLYDLIMQSISSHTKKAKSYILYSKESTKALRYAPLVRAQQLDAMKLRNNLINIELILSQINEPDSYNILENIKEESFPKAKGFNLTDIKDFEKHYTDLDDVSKQYFIEMTSFIAREHRLAKLGSHGLRTSNGQASLWLETEREKEERFSLLRHMMITENDASSDRPFITLKKTNHTSKLANFRKGDIVVLYPDTSEDQPMLRHQIFKCSVVEIKEDTVLILLRNKQNNLSIFNEYQYWNIEPDTLDKSFNVMYKNLFQFAKADLSFREKILNVKPISSQSAPINKWYTEGLSEAKKSLLNKMLGSQDYFLLWGPPGTGKTSIMIQYLVKNLFENTNENILLLAYTNRAVDEMCDAIVSIGSAYMSHFLRIGSSHSTSPKYQDVLLQNKTKTFKKRKALKDYLISKRIYVATVASMIGKHEIFKLKQFDTLIVDEAAQILEPMIIGLLPKVKRFMLIGDHKQLPAVVIQKPEQSLIKDDQLNQLGIVDSKMSLFERLYINATSNKLTWLYDTLHHQGRMHQELMEFPNQQFYNNELQLVPELTRLIDVFPLVHHEEENMNFLASKRRIFIPTQTVNLQHTKTNEEEADKVIDIIEKINKIQELSFAEKDRFSVGVITPYRAQIALVKSKMDDKNIDQDNITVDTVERYQGGSRDIIIISFCVNSTVQMKNLTSLSSDGTDRKLNVALTRAKEQIILIGNEELLSENPVYQQLIHEYNRYPE